jgi:hypothetical protein
VLAGINGTRALNVDYQFGPPATLNSRPSGQFFPPHQTPQHHTIMGGFYSDSDSDCDYDYDYDYGRPERTMRRKKKETERPNFLDDLFDPSIQ